MSQEKDQFQSTPPSLAETVPPTLSVTTPAFQSTPPSLAETVIRAQIDRAMAISIHSAIASGDVFWIIHFATGLDFNPLRHR